MKPDIKHTEEFDVSRHSLQAAAPVQAAQDEHVSFFCCFNKGHMTMTAEAPSNSILPGHEIPLQIKVVAHLAGGFGGFTGCCS